MLRGITKILETLAGRHRHDSLDEVQLDAAQDRLNQRSQELDKSVDELSKMIRRMRRGETKRGNK